MLMLPIAAGKEVVCRRVSPSVWLKLHCTQAPNTHILALLREAEANAYLSLTLTLASLLVLFVTRKLALTLSEREQMKVSQSAMLRCELWEHMSGLRGKLCMTMQCFGRDHSLRRQRMRPSSDRMVCWPASRAGGL